MRLTADVSHDIQHGVQHGMAVGFRHDKRRLPALHQPVRVVGGGKMLDSILRGVEGRFPRRRRRRAVTKAARGGGFACGVLITSGHLRGGTATHSTRANRPGSSQAVRGAGRMQMRRKMRF